MFTGRSRLLVRLGAVRGVWFVLALAGFLVPAGRAAAQKSLADLIPPRLSTVTPCGGRAGTTVTVTLGGVALDHAEKLVFSNPEISAELLPSPAPPPPKPAPPSPKNKPKQKRKGRLPFLPAVRVRFKVTIPAGVPLGNHDVRVVTPGGISNPRVFVVGDLPEILEKEPNNDVEQAQRVPVNTTVHGTIAAPTDVDYFVFRGKKGQRVVVSCLASSIDSRLPAALELYDAKDHLLAANRSYHGSDALLDCTCPKDGDYYLRVFAFTYTQGSLEHFYRLTVSTAPWIDAVYPPMVEPGKPAALTVYGRNLPGGKPDPSAVVDGRVLEKLAVTLDVPDGPGGRQRLAFSGHVPAKSSALDGFEYRLHSDAGASNAVLLTYAQAPVVLDNGKNDTPETAQEVTLPCEIAGRIEKRRDRDWYTFHARRGQVFSVEAYADRLGSPIDLYFNLRSARTGKVLVELDDNPDQLGRTQLFTRNQDPPRYRFAVPADGDYQLQVGSREADVQAGPRDVYRVRIVPEQPDFRLVVMPSSPMTPDACILRRGGQRDLSVFAWRLDGFGEPITVTAEGLPDGVTCRPLTLRPGLREGSLVLEAAGTAPHWTGTITVKGTARIRGREVVREARPATITWGVPVPFFPTVSRLDRELALAVRDQAPYALEAGVQSAVVTHGGRLTVPLKLKRLVPDFKYPVRVFAFNLPPGVPFQLRVLAPGRDETRVTFPIGPNVPPGVYSVVFRAQAQFFTGGKRRRGQLLSLVESAPPISLTVLPRQLAGVSLSPPKVRVEPGGRAEVLVKVARRYKYLAGEFKVRLVSPSKEKGIHAAEVTIPAGKDRAKLVIEVDPEVMAGARSNFIVRVSGRLGGKGPINQEARLTVEVTR
jgi:hypothetical protein